MLVGNHRAAVDVTFESAGFDQARGMIAGRVAENRTRVWLTQGLRSNTLLEQPADDRT